MIDKYALIREGKIVKLRNVPADDTLIVKKMLAHGYLPVSEMPIPPFDYNITLSLSDSYEINTDKVIRKWEVAESPFDEAKNRKEEEIISKALDRIRAAFDSPGKEDLIVSTILTAKKKFMTALNAAKNNIDLRNITVNYEKAEEAKIEVV